MQTSELNLTITIEHDENLPLTAQEFNALVARAIADRVLPLTESPRRYTFGRNAVVGPEDGPNVRSFIRSAFITKTGRPERPATVTTTTEA